MSENLMILQLTSSQQKSSCELKSQKLQMYLCGWTNINKYDGKTGFEANC